MKVIIAGSRWITDYREVLTAVQDSGFSPTEIVSGGARGVDRLGEQYAASLQLKLTIFNADWDQFKNQAYNPAGKIRNTQMAEYADALIAIWDGKSPGTRHMIAEAERLKRKVYIHYAGGMI